MNRHLFCALIVFLILGGTDVYSQQIKVGIWKDGRPTEKFYYHSDEEVVWLVDDNREIKIDAGRTSYFTAEGNTVKLSIAKRTYGRFKNIKLFAGADVYSLKGLNPERKEEKYDQGIEITSHRGELRITNYIDDFDSYVAGVVESESGKGQEKEYYKVQSVISRTYALSNLRRHEGEGFNLCDQVHCQVYHGIPRHDPLALEAARETEGQVIVDSDINLITAAFHSNCGGHTVNSEHVWSKALPYLKGKVDTFCLDGAHATWEAEVLKSAWYDHLLSESSSLAVENKANLYSYTPSERALNYPTASGYPLKDLRYKWKLNSTFFTIEEQGNTLKLRGKGFGHGVGLCQEGGMGMVEQGYTYTEVLQFYYTNTHLVHLSALEFLKEE